MVELGRFALYLTLPFALFALVASIYGARAREEAWIRSGERAVYACVALLTLAMFGTWAAMLGDRFDLAFVASNSSREQPDVFKLAIWSGQAGSLLLWSWILAVMSGIAVFQNRARNRTLMPWVVASLMLNLIFFVGITSFGPGANPFAADADALSNGRGMNPLLQHPVMLIHPPILYIGFVGFAVPFSFAMAALMTGELGTTWFRTTRRWTITAWFFLGCGIMLGGRWAYEVLGWGGYWAWDPVENASLMPWLVGTAYLHSVIIQEKRGMLKIWNLVLIGLTYTLCIFGTFLTRSGVVQSVHSFAGGLGPYFGYYVLVIALLFAAALIWRIPNLRSRNHLDSMVSREASFLFNNFVFLALLFVVLFGTTWPAISETLLDVRVQYGPPWFQKWAGPLAIALLVLTGIGPLIAWRRATVVNLRKSFVWPVAFAIVVGVAVWFVLDIRAFYPWAFLTLCGFVFGTIWEEYYRGVRARMRRGENPLEAFVSLIRRNQRRYAGYIVHLAVLLMFIGFAGAAFDVEQTRLLQQGDTWQIKDYTVKYRQVQPVTHPHYAGAVARLELWKGDEPVEMLYPEKRIYYQQNQPATFPAVSSTMGEDFYVILSGLEPDQSVALKVYINPFVNWLWLGGLVFVIGNALLLWRIPELDRRANP